MTKTKKAPIQTKKERKHFDRVFGFRWLKRSFAGKSRTESMDLLDQWILKKRMMSLFF